MFRQQIHKNKIKTIFVILTYLILFALVGIGIGYIQFDDPYYGVALAIIIGLGYVFVMSVSSTSVVMSMNNATEITSKEEYPQLWNIVEDMAMVAKVPMPRIYIIKDDSPNAFATGFSPEKAAVAATTGLLNMLNREEIEGVIAHEFAHIKNFDIRLQTISVALGAAISILVRYSYSFYGMMNRRRNNDKDDDNPILAIIGVIAVIVGPILATLLQLALSRNREYLADATAVSFTRNPIGLINALEKISTGPKMKDIDPGSQMLYIVNPMKKQSDSLFSTHPSTYNRIERLRKM